MERLFNLAEMEKTLDLSAYKCLGLVARGVIPAVGAAGTPIRVRESDVINYLQQLQQLNKPAILKRQQQVDNTADRQPDIKDIVRQLEVLTDAINCLIADKVKPEPEPTPRGASLDPDRPLKTGEAARFLGVHTCTLRKYEKAGLITPLRSPTGHRLYDLKDLTELLKKVKRKGDHFTYLGNGSLSLNGQSRYSFKENHA